MHGNALYEIDGMYQSYLAQAKEEAEQNEGVIPDDLAAKLDAMEMTRDVKIENSVKYYKNENAIADMLDAEIKALQARARSHRGHAEWLKTYLSAIIKPGEKPEYSCGKISWRKSERTIINDGAKIPVEYTRVIPEHREPELDKIKKALKDGEKIEGAAIEERQNLQIK
jgi:hypothetical protein